MVLSKEETTNTNPTLLLITGRAGSGKTFFSKEIAKRLGWPRIGKDELTREYTNAFLVAKGSSPEERESKAYEEIVPIEYRTTFRAARAFLAAGLSVVVDVPFIRQIQNYACWTELCTQVGLNKVDFRPYFVWMSGDIEYERELLIDRGAKRDTWKLAHWDEYRKKVENIMPAEEYKALVISCGRTPWPVIGMDELIKELAATR